MILAPEHILIFHLPWQKRFMSRQSLIEELDHCSVYTANDALTKANRALADYAGQNTLLDQSQNDQTQRARADIQFEERV